MWHEKDDYPEVNKDIIVCDAEGREYSNHYFNGNVYYYYIEGDDGTCDGFPSDVEIVKWRYALK